MNKTRRNLLLTGAGYPLPGIAASASAIRLILPNAVGSGVDITARSAQSALASALGRPVVVDNQPGAGGVIGLQLLSRAAPDGGTLGFVSNNIAILPSVFQNLPFDVSRDFSPIAIIGYVPVVVVAHPRLGAKGLKELAAKLKSGNLKYGSSGNGTILHLAGELLLQRLDAAALHVPYRGVAPMLSDLLAYQVDFAAVALPSVQGHLRSGALQAIGIATESRCAIEPGLPTLAEQGLPGFAIEAWMAMMGPKGMRAKQVQDLHQSIRAAFDDLQVRAELARHGTVIAFHPLHDLGLFIDSEIAKYQALVRHAGVKLT